MQTYYRQPALKRPHWGWNVVTYLFLGGVMGGSAILGALIPDPPIRRRAKTIAFVLAAINPPLLISHLGRPERFLHMLRIFKAKSPMSLGVWALSAFSGVAALSLLLERREIRSAPLDAANVALGSFICGYTGVLLSATANPLWGKGKWHIPAACVASGISGACAANLALAPNEARSSSLTALERLETAASALELTLVLMFRAYGGAYAKPMFDGKVGERFARFTLVGGVSVPFTLNAASLLRNRSHHGRARRLIAGAATLVGGYIFRETLIEAGKAAADNPELGLVQPK